MVPLAKITFTLLLAWPAPQCVAQEKAVDAGPLLAFTVIAMDSDVRHEVLRVAEIEGAGEYEVHRDKLAARVLSRLGPDHLLLALREPDRLVAVEIQAGRQRELVRGRAKFVDVHGDDVLFLEAPQATGRLYRVPWREPGMPVRVCDQSFDGEPLIVGNVVFALGREDRKVWLVSLVTGRAREVWSIPEGWNQLSTALSPSGMRLAIGGVDQKSCGALTVVDVATGKVLQSFVDLPIWVSMLSSSRPTLAMAFLDDDHIVCSETRGVQAAMTGSFVHVTRSVLSGEITARDTYSGLGLHHRAPPVVVPDPLFEISRGETQSELREVGSANVLAAVDRQREQYGDLLISRPDGRFATARVGERREQLMLFLPGNAVPRQLSTSWAHDLVWLPAIR